MPSDVLEAPAPARSANKDWLRALALTAAIDKAPGRTLPMAIDELAARLGDAPALLSEHERFSFAELADRARRYARWGMDQGLAKGDVVALVMGNRPEFLAIWLGLTRLGVVVALINTSLRGPSLAHALKVAASRRIIVSAELHAGVAEVAVADVWAHGEADAFRIDWAVEDYDAEALAAVPAPVATLSDRALLIYTSGTTGLPKAANVSHHRVMMWSHWFAGLMDAGPADRMYNCLPLHHSVGGVVATAAVLVAGGSVVIAEKFSARRFWDDVVRWDCTLFQYIGELCRYLTAAPAHPKERSHALRLVCGNGLQGEVWTAFQARFAIPRVLEFYAATEGAFSLYNVEGRPGAIGRIPSFLAHRFPAAIVRYDARAGAPARGADGFCARVERGEVGEAIGRIAGGAADGRFEGYTDAGESDRKVLRDVFARGDAWVRTGDLMRQDEQGFFYFVDRIGDTFRWKGENVSTAEVAQAIGAFPGVTAASVYGVEVAGAPGRAGMATIAAAGDLNLAALRAHLSARLPAYARPVFLRLARDLEVTETFKPKKQALVEEGFDPARIADALFFDDREGGYTPLDAAAFEAIQSGALKL